jgi:multidrug efflux pump subunit AcrA (membrane-fusion protein)
MGFRLAALPRTAGRRVALWSVIAATALAIAAVGAFAHLNRDLPAAAASKTTLATVRRGTVTVTEAAAGTVQATNTRGLSFAISGTVTQISVTAGDTVTSGEVLARIDDSDAQDAVSSAESSVANAEQALSNAQATASATPSTGCVAVAAYPSSSPSPAPRGARSPSPSAVRSITPSRAATGGTGSRTGGTTCATSQGGGGRAGNGSDSIYTAQQQLNNARLALAQARANLAGTVIKAPVDGKVLSVDGTVGTTEAPGGTAFITLGSTQDTAVQAQFSEADVASLKVGQAAKITLVSRTDAFAGKVSQIAPAGTTSGQLVRYTVIIAFDGPPDDLLYGQSANVVVTTGSVANVLYVSSSAVTVGSGDSGTVTVRTGGHDEQRTVQMGLRGDQYTEIRSGLSEGEQVVVSGGG